MNRTFPLAAALLAFLCLPAQAQPRSLSLEEAYELSEANAEALRVKVLGVQKSQLRLTEARARSLPRVTLEASGSYLTNPPEGVTVKAGELGSLPFPYNIPIPQQDIVFIEDAEPTYFSLSASLGQPVYTWGKITSGIRLAALELAGSRAELEQQKADLRQEVHRAYFGALLAERSLPVLETMRGALAEIVSDRERSFAEGLITRGELLEARANLTALERRLTENKEALNTALQSLQLITGLPASEFSLSSSFRADPPEIDEQRSAEAALRESSELRIARNRIEQAREKLHLERGGGLLRPDISLTLAFDLSGQKVPFTVESWDESWNWNLILSLGTSVKLFDGAEAGSRIGQAQKDLEIAGLTAVQAENMLRLRLRRAVQEVRLAESELREKQARLEAAREQEKNVRVSFENELATREELRSASLAFGSARLEELSALHHLESSLAELERLTGIWAAADSNCGPLACRAN